MKNKTMIIIISSILAIVVTSIIVCYFIFKKPNETYYIHLRYSNITREVGDVFNVVDECEITTYANGNNTNPYFISEDNNYLEVNSVTGDCECLKEGQTKIFVYLQTENNIINKEINIIINNKVVEPTYLTIQNNSVVLTDSITSVINTLSTDAQNCRTIISYKNNIVQYDLETETVSSKGLYGVDKVTIRIYKKDNSYLETSFDVMVKENNNVSQTYEIKINEVKKITYESFITESNTDIGQPTVSDTSVLELLISDYGYFKIKGLKVGQSELTITDGLNQIKILIIVTE